MTTTSIRCFIEIEHHNGNGNYVGHIASDLLSALPPQFRGNWVRVRRNKYGAMVFKHETDLYVSPDNLSQLVLMIKKIRGKTEGWFRIYLKTHTGKEIK